MTQLFAEGSIHNLRECQQGGKEWSYYHQSGRQATGGRSSGGAACDRPVTEPANTVERSDREVDRQPDEESLRCIWAGEVALSNS